MTNPNSVAVLRECPFCGVTDALRLANTHTASFWVECDEAEGGCGGRASGQYFEGPQRKTRFSYDPDARTDDKFSARTLDELHPEYRKAAESAIAAWNRRAALSAVYQIDLGEGYEEISRERFEQYQRFNAEHPDYYDLRTLYLHHAQPAGEDAVTELVDEMRELAEWPFEAQCCNSTFPIAAVRRVLTDAAAAITSRTGKEISNG